MFLFQDTRMTSDPLKLLIKIAGYRYQFYYLNNTSEQNKKSDLYMITERYFHLICLKEA